VGKGVSRGLLHRVHVRRSEVHIRTDVVGERKTPLVGGLALSLKTNYVGGFNRLPAL
jgi:hypothetical protein